MRHLVRRTSIGTALLTPTSASRRREEGTSPVIRAGAQSASSFESAIDPFAPLKPAPQPQQGRRLRTFGFVGGGLDRPTSGRCPEHSKADTRPQQCGSGGRSASPAEIPECCHTLAAVECGH